MQRYRGVATRARRARLLERDGAACWWCTRPFTADLPATIDHLVPHSRGGSSDDDNLVLACAPCNSGRDDLAACAACGHKIRRWTAAFWVARRLPFHESCGRRIVKALAA